MSTPDMLATLQAVYDKESGEFVIHTPTDTASKFWIGGSAQHGKVCTVFAQLTVNGKWEGPHVFVVRLRDDQGKLNKGVRIRDNGPKMGLNGVDNGQIWFEHVRIPRDALLNRFADVAPDGIYSSPFPTVGQRFGVTVGGLTTGACLLACLAAHVCLFSGRQETTHWEQHTAIFVEVEWQSWHPGCCTNHDCRNPFPAQLEDTTQAMQLHHHLPASHWPIMLCGIASAQGSLSS